MSFVTFFGFAGDDLLVIDNSGLAAGLLFDPIDGMTFNGEVMARNSRIQSDWRRHSFDQRLDHCGRLRL